MHLTVGTDPQAGFCGGVIRAIGRAEEYLGDHDRLHSLGAIVHNEAELERLSARGLVTVGSVEEVPEGDGSVLLIRAHGEPPETYRKAAARNLEVIDCTCPVVLRLQQRIREAYARLHAGGKNGKLLIFGKIGHAEVLGLLGQVAGDAIVVENREMLEEVLRSGRIDPDQPVEIFSQTTKSPTEYAALCGRLREALGAVHPEGAPLQVHDTICSQVAGRHVRLAQFAREHDVVVFVSGTSSSNGKVLYELCRSVNPRTFRIGAPDDIRPEWFSEGDRVGVSGATSTPKWLLEDVAAALRGL